ncbi:cupin domain-containing protein [Evansella sp. AB-P1]|uniref:cupin domain-containing protein n=1 Tax=Evansella sp. AB-P1 TaxID=3037653 RepID=UPI00241DB4E9|nr:cupin domain-containing protein [Evansella sp. AB-P1]MDG5787054.1 cupin domain-containing protein [Evansella sp. AB-P1]
MNLEERSIVHGITGEKITFLESCHETNGEYLKIKVDLPPKGEGPPLHYHKAFEELFEVIEGELTITVEGKNKSYFTGEQVKVPKLVNHTFYNATDKPASFYVTLTPGHHFEESMRIAYGLIADKKINKQGVPKNLIHTAILLKMQDSNIVEMPKFVSGVLFNSLYGLGRLFGVQKSLEKKYLPKHLIRK